MRWVVQLGGRRFGRKEDPSARSHAREQGEGQGEGQEENEFFKLTK